MNPVKMLLDKAVEGNSIMSKTDLSLYIYFMATAGVISPQEKEELLNKLNPPIQQTEG